MPVETPLPEQQTENPPENPRQSLWYERLWERVRDLWQRERSRQIALVIAFFLIPLLALLIVGGFYYLHYARVIDAQLRGGPFRDSVDIYGAPSVFSDGDGL